MGFESQDKPILEISAPPSLHFMTHSEVDDRMCISLFKVKDLLLRTFALKIYQPSILGTWSPFSDVKVQSCKSQGSAVLNNQPVYRRRAGLSQYACFTI